MAKRTRKAPKARKTAKGGTGRKRALGPRKPRGVVLGASDAQILALLRVPDVDPAALEKSVRGIGSPALANDLDRRFQEASRLYLEAYLEEKRGRNTHQLITAAALRILGVDETAPEHQSLIDESLGPDRTIATLRLMMEGHFHGAVPDGGTGNFLPAYFPGWLVAFLGRLDDVAETARSNFTAWFAKVDATPGSTRLHGFTMHYLQDVTAPHHAANIPSILPALRKEPDTHRQLERHANALFDAARTAYDQDARIRLADVRAQGFNLASPLGREQLFDWTHGESMKNAGPGLHDPATWDARIGSALALAIAVTARYLEHHAGPLHL
jgi:hypothetical protein